MSRLTDLIAQAKVKIPTLGQELEKEFKVLAARRSFGLNFERHRPESVELPGRLLRKGDKVHVLPPRGSTIKGDQHLWKVLSFDSVKGKRLALIEQINTAETEQQQVPVEDLVVVAEFNDYIYPGLVSTGKVERSSEKPFHTVINGENFHALEALTFTHRGKVDAIYIDPPYNSGARDWKYNNDFVGEEDLYRHSKWLAMIERRLNVSKTLLNPENSVLILTIDEKEYLRLGLLLEQVFPDAKIQMVTTAINATGTIRVNEFTRVNEYIFFALFGSARISPEPISEANSEVPWNLLQRREMPSRRGGPKPGPDQFYPIYVDNQLERIKKIGEPIALGVERTTVPELEGCTTLFPLKPDGTEMSWGLSASSLTKSHEKGYVKVTKNKRKGSQGFNIYYLTSGKVRALEEGKAKVIGHNSDESVQAIYIEGQTAIPTTMWMRDSHNAQSHGTKLLSKFLPGRKFPFPKSLYAVEDALRCFIQDKPNATVLDFFSGSGTTSHAVMRLNQQDQGMRRCISVTNNEVAADEQATLLSANLRPGDEDWERWGICDYITKPRIAAAITGNTPDGDTVKGKYKFNDEFPMAEGFEENAEFFTLTYETPVAISHNRAFARIAPLLWMRAGSEGKRIGEIPSQGWEVVDTYGLLTDLDKATPFCKSVSTGNTVRIAYIVTDDERRFQSVVRQLPHSVEPVRLYESYLKNFRFSMGR